jgi:hypothetical protein
MDRDGGDRRVPRQGPRRAPVNRPRVGRPRESSP